MLTQEGFLVIEGLSGGPVCISVDAWESPVAKLNALVIYARVHGPVTPLDKALLLGTVFPNGVPELLTDSVCDILYPSLFR